MTAIWLASTRSERVARARLTMRIRRQGQRFARGSICRVIHTRFEARERIGCSMMSPDYNHKRDNPCNYEHSQPHNSPPPIHLREEQRDEIERTTFYVREWRRFRKLLIPAEFCVQSRHDLRHIQLQ